MKKIALLALLALTLVLAFSACQKAEPAPLIVCSFHGETEQFSVSNGVLVLSDTEDLFYGGTLTVQPDAFSDMVSYSATFYVQQGNEEKTLLSNGVVDQTGGSVRFGGDLGRLSGANLLRDHRIENPGDFLNNLFFELQTTDRQGRSEVHQIPLTVTELTDQIGQ